MPQQLNYLLFDATDEESGACGFDAMASVLPDRLPALLAEVQAVLAWATGLFGSPSGADVAGDEDDEGDAEEWSFDLQATDETGAPVPITWDVQRNRGIAPAAVATRTTLTLTVSGPRAFADAFRQAFPE